MKSVRGESQKAPNGPKYPQTADKQTERAFKCGRGNENILLESKQKVLRCEYWDGSDQGLHIRTASLTEMNICSLFSMLGRIEYIRSELSFFIC